MNPQLRSTAWQGVRWVRAKKPKAFAFENVPEFEQWGPVVQMDKRGVPLFLRNDGSEKKTKWVLGFAPVRTRPSGMSTKTWWAKMADLGYKPAFKPDPKHRGVTFQKWLTHLRREGYVVGHRVLNAADYGAPTARKRLIIVGALRSAGMRVVWPRPTHAKVDAAGLVPMGVRPWVGAKTIIQFEYRGTSIFERARPLKEKTIRRILAGMRKFWLRPFLMPGQGYDQLRTRTVDLPLQAIATNSRGEALVTAAVTPVSTILAEPNGLTMGCDAQTFLLKYRGTNNASDINAPAPTVTAGGTHLGMIETFLVQVAHGGAPAADGARARSVAEPLPTVCGNRGDMAVCSTFLTQVSHGVGPREKSVHSRRVKPIAEPLPTVTGSNDWGVTQAFLMSQQSCGAPRGLDMPTPTVATAGAIHLVEVACRGVSVPDLHRLSDETMEALDAEIMRLALHPGCGRPRVAIDGQVFEIEVYHRMLDAVELAGAQSFPKGYRFAGTKTDAIRMIGNAVPPLLARAVVKALWSQDENVGAFEMPIAA